MDGATQNSRLSIASLVHVVSSESTAMFGEYFKPLILIVGFAWASCGHAEVVVVAAANSAIGSLNREEVVSIFLAKSRMIGSLSIKPLDINIQRLQTEFHTKVIGMSEDQYKAYWSRLIFTGKAFPPKEVATVNEAKQRLSDNPNLITYAPIEAVDASLKIIYRSEK